MKIGHYERSIFWICVIVCMALSITALTVALPREVDSINPTRLDYQGVYVAIFALLVTVLIGWQINSTLGIEKKVETHDALLEKKISEIEVIKAAIDKTSKDSENLNLGLYYCLASAANYNQMRLGGEQDKSERAKALIRSYILACISIVYILKSNKDIATLKAPVRLSFYMVQIADKQLHELEKDIVKNAYTKEDHNQCDQLYTEMLKFSDIIGSDKIEIINEVRNKRKAFKQ